MTIFPKNMLGNKRMPGKEIPIKCFHGRLIDPHYAWLSLYRFSSVIFVAISIP